MEQVKGSNAQAMPLWERRKKSQGHYSSVDGAVQAHRQRKLERENRVAERLNMVQNMQTQFFPSSNVMNRPEINNQPLQAPVMQNQANIENQIPAVQNIEVPNVKDFNPIEMDEIYNEASMGSVADNAFGIVQKEIANPEEGPIDDMPKGSYVDYTV